MQSNRSAVADLESAGRKDADLAASGAEASCGKRNDVRACRRSELPRDIETVVARCPGTAEDIGADDRGSNHSRSDIDSVVSAACGAAASCDIVEIERSVDNREAGCDIDTIVAGCASLAPYAIH